MTKDEFKRFVEYKTKNSTPSENPTESDKVFIMIDPPIHRFSIAILTFYFISGSKSCVAIFLNLNLYYIKFLFN